MDYKTKIEISKNSKNCNRNVVFQLYLEQISHGRKVCGITYSKGSSKIHIVKLIKKYEIFGYN